MSNKTTGEDRGTHPANIAADVAAAEAARRSPEDQDIEDEDAN